MNRTSFYECSRRYQTQGWGGLKDLPPIHNFYPHTVVSEVLKRDKALVLEHPAYGFDRIELVLALERKCVSMITVQKSISDRGPPKRGAAPSNQDDQFGGVDITSSAVGSRSTEALRGTHSSPACSPQICGDVERLDLPLLPPGFLVASCMEIAVVKRAEGDGELVRNLPAHGAGLGKAEVMRFGG